MNSEHGSGVSTVGLEALCDEGWLSEILEKRGLEVPNQVWDQVLLDPARAFLSRPGKGLRAKFVHLGWSLAGGKDAPPKTLLAIIELLHSGSLIVDDIEDNSSKRRGVPCLHRVVGLGPALNVGNWMYFVAHALVDEIDVAESIKYVLYRELNRTLLRCHHGQGLDLGVRVFDLDQDSVPGLVEASTRLKTGALTGFALRLGGVTLGQPADENLELSVFGERVGVGLQMYDDYSGVVTQTRAHKGIEDLRMARLTWPWAWLARCQPAEVFTSLQKEAQEPSEAEALRGRIAELLGDAEPLIEQELDGAYQSAMPLFRDNKKRAMVDRALAQLKVSYL